MYGVTSAGTFSVLYMDSLSFIRSVNTATGNATTVRDYRNEMRGLTGQGASGRWAMSTVGASTVSWVLNRGILHIDVVPTEGLLAGHYLKTKNDAKRVTLEGVDKQSKKMVCCGGSINHYDKCVRVKRRQCDQVLVLGALAVRLATVGLKKYHQVFAALGPNTYQGMPRTHKGYGYCGGKALHGNDVWASAQSELWLYTLLGDEKTGLPIVSPSIAGVKLSVDAGSGGIVIDGSRLYVLGEHR